VIVGTPRWNTTAGAHLVYIGTASGKIYRLVDNGSSLVPDTTWATNPFNCSCTIVTPLTLDTTNVYWGGTQNGQRIWTLGQGSELQPTGSPLSITPTITSAAPAFWSSAGVSYLFVGLTGHVLQTNLNAQVLAADNTNPGSASVWGRIGIGTKSGSTRVFVGDDGGTMWALDALNFGGANKVWSYHEPAGNPIKGSVYFDYASNTIQYGTQGGTLIVVDSAGAPFAGYPYLPGTGNDAIGTAILYSAGLLVVGTKTGKLFFLDRTTGAGPALIREYAFGPTEEVSGVAYDSNTNRYMVTTSDATTKDGRLYYFDVLADPTPSKS
jgi:hypothetical protein